jgi:small-conductance mechanosensitive channel
MIREIGIFLGLLVSAAALYFVDIQFSIAYLGQIASSLLSISVAYLFFEIIVARIGNRTIKDAKTRYSFKKAVYILFIATVAVLLIRVWVEDAQSLLLSYGIIAAGVAIALQDFFRSFVNGIAVAFSGVYRVGDRIEVDGIFGDVMDIGLLNTTLMEMRGWVHGDQPTGRIVMIPNNAALSNKVFNYTKDHSFIWDEIVVPITYDSDWKGAIEIFLGIIRNETGEVAKQAEQEIDRIGEVYYLPRKVTEPAVFLTVTDNWISIALRYVTDVKSRRSTSDRINRLILEAVESSEHIRIASATFEITGKHTVRLTESGKNP